MMTWLRREGKGDSLGGSLKRQMNISQLEDAVMSVY